MFQGTSIDDLIQMVERAEQHACELADEDAAGLRPMLVYEAQRSEELVGVA